MPRAFLDCPPSLVGVLTFNALVAARWLVVPVEASYLALEGLSTLTETAEVVRRQSRSKLELGAVIPCVVRRTRLAREVVENLRLHFGPLVTSTVIRANVKVAEAPARHQPIIKYAPDSNGAADYQAVSAELLRKLK